MKVLKFLGIQPVRLSMKNNPWSSKFFFRNSKILFFSGNLSFWAATPVGSIFKIRTYRFERRKGDKPETGRE